VRGRVLETGFWVVGGSGRERAPVLKRGKRFCFLGGQNKRDNNSILVNSAFPHLVRVTKMAKINYSFEKRQKEIAKKKKKEEKLREKKMAKDGPSDSPAEGAQEGTAEGGAAGGGADGAAGV